MHLVVQGTAHALFFAGRYDEAAARASMALREHADIMRRCASLQQATRLLDEGKKRQTWWCGCVGSIRTLRVSNLRNALGPYRHHKNMWPYTRMH